MDVWVVLFEGIGEPEGDHRQTSIVVRRSLVLLAKDLFLDALEGVFTLLAVNVRYANVPTSSF